MAFDGTKGKRRRKTVSKLSAQRGERLIETVRANMALYDPSQKGYADFAIKAKLWNDVAAACGLKSGHEAKMVWKNLRDCYRICRKKMHYNPNAKTWKFYDRMKFLTPYIKDRKWKYLYRPPKPQEAIESAPPDTSVVPEVNNSVDVSETDREFTTVQYWNDGENKFDSIEAEPEAPVVQSAVVNTPQENQPIAREVIRPDSPVESETESFEDVLPEALNNGTVDQSLKMFFDAMYASTSSLPPNLQRRVKNKIFTAVLEGEEDAEKIAKTPRTTPPIITIKSEL